MLGSKFGVPPSRWIHNLAHVIVRERGFTRDTPEQDRRFVAALVDVTEEAFEKYLRRRTARRTSDAGGVALLRWECRAIYENRVRCQPDGGADGRLRHRRRPVPAPSRAGGSSDVFIPYPVFGNYRNPEFARATARTRRTSWATNSA